MASVSRSSSKELPHRDSQREASRQSSVRSKGSSTRDPMEALFEDDGDMDSMLKAMVDTGGLSTGWERVQKRLAGAEAQLRNIQKGIETREFIMRAEFDDTVTTKHGGTLKEHTDELAIFKDSHSRLLTIVNEQHGPDLQNCMSDVRHIQDRLKSVEDDIAELLQSEEDKKRRVQEGIAMLNTFVQDNIVERVNSLEELIRGQKKEIFDKMKKNEDRMKNWTVKEIKRVTTRMLDPDAEDDDEEEEDYERDEEDATSRAGSKSGELGGRDNNDRASPSSPRRRLAGEKEAGPKGLQKKVIDVVEKNLLEPIRIQLEQAQAGVQACDKKVDKQSEDIGRQIKGIDKSLGDFKLSFREKNEDIKEKLGQRLTKEDASVFEDALKDMVNDLIKDVEDLRSSAVTKLNEFVEHFAKVHESIEDHEHCLRHHAEEIENRSTKYDLLACQRQLDNSAPKQDFLRETADLRQLLSWQTKKIESFGLIAGSGVNRRRTAARAGSGQASPRDASGGGDDDNMMGSMGDDDAGETGLGRNQTLLTEQLNALSMGVTWLAHLLLQEPKLGASRNQRLAQEQEILEELKNIRHWITHRTSPAGWDSKRLTTAALEISHPHEASPVMPQATISMLPPPKASAGMQPMPPLEEKKAMSARRLAAAPDAKVRMPQSARLSTSSLSGHGSNPGLASMSTLASDGDIPSNKASRDMLPKMGMGELRRFVAGQESPKASRNSSSTSLPPLARMGATS